MKNKTKLCATALWLLTAAALNSETAKATAGANLNQARNGTDTIPVSPVNWVNGNVGLSNAHYNEEMSAPFQCIMTSLTPGVQVTITIGYDIRNSSKNAYDFLTHYNRLLPHTFNLHNSPETINPLSGSGLPAATAYTTYPIPAPSSAGSPMSGEPTNSFNALASSERLMTLYNGVIDSMYYVVQGNLNASQSETQVAIKFTPVGATAVLAWGGHIGSRNVWGYSGMSPNSAGGISGSPFHMRLVGWSLGSLGSTDRSISGYTVGPPAGWLPVELVHFSVNAIGTNNVVEWTTASEINNDHFSVQRAADGLNFETIATIKGAGNSTRILNYAWFDFTAPAGVNYYRLVQTDYDGTQKIFDPVSIKATEANSALSIIKAFPNPFNDELSVTYQSERKTSTLIELDDLFGRHIYSDIQNSVPGANYFKYTDRNSLPDGFYFITITQSKTMPVKKMIIKK